MSDRVARAARTSSGPWAGGGMIAVVLIVVIVLSGAWAAAPSARTVKHQARLNQAEIDAKVNALIAKMTVAEKFGQLTMSGPQGPNGTPGDVLVKEVRDGQVGSILDMVGVQNINALQKAALQSRLHIPLIFSLDVIHGYKTQFPIGLGEASTWDPALISRDEAVSASEATADGIKWTFNPMVDISRDPRWGRVEQNGGEDPFLGSAIAVAKVKGYQGNDFSAADRMAATVKHFAAYGAPVAGREYNTVDMSTQQLFNYYLPPYKAAIDAGAATVMSAFNSLNGVPSSGNAYLLNKILRQEWGFGGPVVSDYQAVQELAEFGFASSLADAARLALNAGVDIEMAVTIPSIYSTYHNFGPQLVASGKIKMSTLNTAVRRVLTLSPSLGSVAVVGPLANNPSDQLGPDVPIGYDPTKGKIVTVLDGIKAAVPHAAVTYAQGCDPNCTDSSGFAAAVAAAQGAQETVVVVGEPAADSGEASSRSDIGLPGNQLALVQAIAATGKPYVVVLMNGRPLTISWLADHAPGLLEAWFPGTEGGHAVADVLFGKVNPGGKLPMTFPRNVGQIPISYNELPTGRPYNASNKYTSRYLDVPNSPQYPFGWGLSYTTFSLTGLQLSSRSVPRGGPVTVSATLTNTGSVTGDDTVQLYIREKYTSILQPVRKLEGFERITLKPGQSRAVHFTLGPSNLGFYNNDGRYVLQGGPFDVWVSDSSWGGLHESFTMH
jgi:beta-glucosidase